MRILFSCSQHVYRAAPFDGMSLETGIGGSEAALVHVAEGLAHRGHRVEVVGASRTNREINGVSWSADDAGREFDVLIVFRFAGPVLAGRRAPLRVLWTTDLPTDQTPYRLSRSLRRADAVVALSPFHASVVRQFAKEAGIGPAALRLAILACPIDARSYRRVVPKVRHRFLHCSVPDRGRDTLLRLWPHILARLPEATLVVTGGYGLWGRAHLDTRPPHLAGVDFRGVLSRSQLVLEQMQAEVHLHPCRVAENFCMASAECQAAATPSVASAAGALPTTVLDGRTGVVVEGPPFGEPFERRFADEAVRLVTDPPRLATLASAARRRAHEQFDRTIVAAAWEQQLDTWLTAGHVEGSGQ